MKSGKYRGSKEYMVVYSELINAARSRSTLTYQDIAPIMGLPLTGSHMGKEIGALIGEISEDEVNLGRPLLSALVINVTGSPGPGFYGWAEDLGRLKVGESKADQRKFWDFEKKAVYDTWSKWAKWSSLTPQANNGMHPTPRHAASHAA